MAMLGGLFEGDDEPLSHPCGECLKRCNRRACGAVFDSADVGLADTGLLGELLLCHVLCNSCGNQRARYFKLRTHGFVFFPKLRIFHLLCFVFLQITHAIVSFHTVYPSIHYYYIPKKEYCQEEKMKFQNKKSKGTDQCQEKQT